MRKPHAKSKLKTPEDPERMREIYFYLAGNPDAEPPQPAHSLAETEAWLAAQGVDTNRNSLSEFFHWYPVWRQMQAASDTTAALKDVLTEIPNLNLSETQLRAAMQATFEAQALQQGNPKLFVALKQLAQTDRSLDLQELTGKTRAQFEEAKLKQKDRDLAIAERKLELLEAKAREATEVAHDSKLTPAQQAERMREIFKKA